MEFIPLPIEGAYEIRCQTFRDSRGTFVTTYDAKRFAEKELVTNWLSINQSFNISKGTLRGLHFQTPPFTQTKLVRAATGSALDVLVDLRKNSPSFLKTVAVEITSEKSNSLYIPKGCAHGYLTLSDGCLIVYHVDDIYAPQNEGGLAWNDPAINFKWPLATEPILSDKDRCWQPFYKWDNPF